MKLMRADEIGWARPIPKAGFDLNERGAAEALCHDLGESVRFDHRRKRWLLWREHRWVPDADGAIVREAVAFVRRQQHAALDIADSIARKLTTEHWAKFDRHATLLSLLSFASNLLPISDAGNSWDRQPMLLGCPNGVVDCGTGHLRPGQPCDLITRTTAVPYFPDAACPRWERFVADVVDHDPAMLAFIHRALGYSITGLTTEQVLFLKVGSGLNGKGVMQRVIRYTLGDYAAVMPFTVLEQNQRASIPNDLAALDGPRYVMSSETSDAVRLNEARVKALTGSDPISARFLHGEFFTFEPQAKFWLATNHLPVVVDDSYGFWRRIRQIPFRRTFQVTPGFEEGLLAEASGVLAWLVRGCLLWQQGGLQTPQSVLAATDAYRAHSDVLADFLAEACELTPEAEIGAADLFQHYVAWATKSGLTERERLTATKFGTKVGERFQRVHSRHGKVYQGIARRAR